MENAAKEVAAEIETAVMAERKRCMDLCKEYRRQMATFPHSDAKISGDNASLIIETWIDLGK